MVALPVDRERLVDLHILARLDTAPAQNALVRIVAVERVRHVFFVRLRRVGPRLMLYVEIFSCVVDGAIAIVVVADRAVQHVILKNPVEGLALRDVHRLACCLDLHASRNLCRTGPRQLAVDLDDAGIAALDRAHLLQVADMRYGLLRACGRSTVEQVDQQFAGMARNLDPIDGQLGVWSVVGGSVQQRFCDSHISLRCFSEVESIALSHPHYTQPALTESLQEKSSRGNRRGIQNGLSILSEPPIFRSGTVAVNPRRGPARRPSVRSAWLRGRSPSGRSRRYVRQQRTECLRRAVSSAWRLPARQPRHS